MAAISHLISQLWLQAAGQTHCLGQPGLGEEWSGLTDLPLLHRETACLQITHTASHPAASLQQSSSFWSGYKSLAKRGRHHIPHLILTTDLQNTIIFSRLRLMGVQKGKLLLKRCFITNCIPWAWQRKRNGHFTGAVQIPQTLQGLTVH